MARTSSHVADASLPSQLNAELPELPLAPPLIAEPLAPPQLSAKLPELAPPRLCAKLPELAPPRLNAINSTRSPE